MESLIITKPDDWHVHFRDGDELANTVLDSAKHFRRALVMPNLKPALTTIKALLAYKTRIDSTYLKDIAFTPYFSLYLNEQVTTQDIHELKQYSFILGAKLYPQGATTHSDEGVQSLKALYPLFDVMQSQDLVLQVHGETTSGDIFDREEVFLVEELLPLINNFPKLRIVVEHISTKAAVDFVLQQGEKVAATITPHHLQYNRNHLLAGGIKPHYYCLPILKREACQQALIQAAISGNPQFFAGTDSAPHAIQDKQSDCGCAGIYSAPFALPFYTHCFDLAHSLPKLEGFISHFGADFYQLPRNTESIELIKKTQKIPTSLPFGKNKVIPMGANEKLPWSVKYNES